MGHPVRSRSKTGLIAAVSLVCFQCSNHTSPVILWVNADTVSLRTTGGITYRNDTPFSGILFSLYNQSDTAFIMPYTNGKQNGWLRSWYPYGQLKETRYFQHGSKEGEHRGWWENGRPKYIYHFKNDRYEGNVKQWSSNKLIYRDMNYVNGQEYGEQKLWYDNGKIRSNYIVKNNRRYGLLGTKNCINVVDSIPAIR